MQRVQEAHYLHSLSDLAVENSEPESALHSAPGGGMLTIADAPATGSGGHGCQR